MRISLTYNVKSFHVSCTSTSNLLSQSTQHQDASGAGLPASPLCPPRKNPLLDNADGLLCYCGLKQANLLIAADVSRACKDLLGPANPLPRRSGAERRDLAPRPRSFASWLTRHASPTRNRTVSPRPAVSRASPGSSSPRSSRRRGWSPPPTTAPRSSSRTCSAHSKYDHRDPGFSMAYGSGDIVISSPLACRLARAVDSCVLRYPHLYAGRDLRLPRRAWCRAHP
jgi:hypothetical protein